MPIELVSGLLVIELLDKFSIELSIELLTEPFIELRTASSIRLFTGVSKELWVGLLIGLSIKSLDKRGSISSEHLQFSAKTLFGISVLTTLIK